METIESKDIKFPVGWRVPKFNGRIYGPKKTDYAVCVFMINEGEKIKKQLREMAQFAPAADIILADGGSTDGVLTDELMQETGVRALLTKRQKGKLGTQMRMAFAWVLTEGYKGVVVIDGNDKDDVSAVPAFVKAMAQGVDHIQGSRFVPGGKAINTPFSRLIGLKILHAPVISIAAGHRYTDTTNGFRAYSRTLLTDPRVSIFRDIFTGYEVHYYLAIRASKLGYKIKELPVTRAYPKGQPAPTKISPIKGNLGIIRTLFKAAGHKFDPTPEEEKEHARVA